MPARQDARCHQILSKRQSWQVCHRSATGLPRIWAIKRSGGLGPGGLEGGKWSLSRVSTWPVTVPRCFRCRGGPIRSLVAGKVLSMVGNRRRKVVWTGVTAVVLLTAGWTAWTHWPVSWHDKERCETWSVCGSRCEQGDGYACALLADMYADGRGVIADPRKVVELLARGCDADDSTACFRLAIAYEQGRGVDKDEVRHAELSAKAYALHRRECNSGVVYACHDLANDYRYGRGTTADAWRYRELMDQTIAVYRDGCNAGNALRCSDLALEYASGDEVAKSQERAIELDAKACQLGRTSACWSAGYSARNAERFQDAETYFKKGCDGSDESSCKALSELYGESPFNDPQRQRIAAARAAVLLEALCEAEQVSACRDLVALYTQEGGVLSKDLAKARSWTERLLYLEDRACANGHAYSCMNAAGPYLIGRGVKKDNKRAQFYYKRGCDLGYEIACRFLEEQLVEVVDFAMYGAVQCAVKRDGSVWCWAATPKVSSVTAPRNRARCRCVSTRYPHASKLCSSGKGRAR